MQNVLADARAFDVEDHPGRQSWLLARNTGISGTDALVIADEMHPYARDTRYTLWAKKSGYSLPEDQLPSRFMDWGNRLEPVLHRWAVEETGIQFERRPFRLLRRRDKPHLICSPDAVAWGDHVGIELKTTSAHLADNWEDDDSGEPVVPLHYLVQVQHTLLVTGWQEWFVAVLIGGNDPRVMTVQRNEPFLAALEAGCDELWQRVLDGDPPELAGREPPERAILRLFWPTAAPGTVVTLPPEALELHEQRVLGERLAERGIAMKEAAKLKIERMIGAAEVGMMPDKSGAYYLRNASRVGYQPKFVQPWSGRRLTFKPKKSARKPKKT